MKKTIITIALFTASILVLAGCGESYPSKLSVYPFKTAVIQYELSGGTQGDRSVFIRGDQKAVHTFITTPGQEKNLFELYLGNEKYIANLDKMTAIKAVDTNYDKMLKLNKKEQEEYLIKKSLGLKTGVKLPKPITTSMVGGQQCDVYEIANIGTACMWHGIALQKEITLDGITNKIVAVKVDVDAKIPAERFELPAGVIVTQ
ncbi:hypothetical protein J7J83_01845 [bacterium]|nr:hypothetical protein [bacterium]